MSDVLNLSKSEVSFIQGLRKRDKRMATGLTIVEGYPETKRAYVAKVPFEKLYICPEIFVPVGDEFKGIEIINITKESFAAIAFGERLKGILALCKPEQPTLTDLKLKEKPFIMMLEGVEKPGNLGAVLRTSDGAGVDAVIMCNGKTDIFNHNVVRSSIGTVFTVPVVSATNEEALSFLNEHNINIYAATAHTDELYTDCDLEEACAVIVGTEHDGLSDFWVKNAKTCIKIPMEGAATCLNVAMSASIIAYEGHRQRN
ncbi:MAG: TrmH family RNA methyltransferase [Lysobacterales bacterium]|jgi:TrmH family RNA methyltransferase